MLNVVYIGVELLFLSFAHTLGGPPGTVIGAVAVATQSLAGVRVESLALMVPGLAWLALSHSTGNRELFFPFTMHLAAVAALCESPTRALPSRWLGPLGGGVVVGGFMIIRILQRATVRVLVVEFVVAAAILALVLVARAWSARSDGRIPPLARHAMIVVASSLLAYASLAI